MEADRGVELTEDEYLERERRSVEKHEYFDGRMRAMSGGSPRHNLICGNVLVALSTKLAGRPCLVFSADQRIFAPPTGIEHPRAESRLRGSALYTYADASVVCGRPTYHPKDAHTLVNPLVIVEVLSQSTAVYDRMGKFARYNNASSLQEYLLVEQDDRVVEHYRRADGNQWILTLRHGSGAVPLPALDIEISLDEIYAKTDLLADDAVD